MNSDGVRPELVAKAREELDRLDGTLIPEFVQVIDGWYQEKIVGVELPDCIEVVSPCSYIPVSMICRTEPCHIPRYRTELRWVRPESS
jgi:hypothetical protein